MNIAATLVELVDPAATSDGIARYTLPPASTFAYRLVHIKLTGPGGLVVSGNELPEGEITSAAYGVVPFATLSFFSDGVAWRLMNAQGGVEGPG